MTEPDTASRERIKDSAAVTAFSIARGVLQLSLRTIHFSLKDNETCRDRSTRGRSWQMHSGLILAAVEQESPLEHPTAPRSSAEEQQQQDDDAEFNPCIFFSYGCLMDPEVLMDAWVAGFEMRLWNRIYPELLPGAPQSRIKGTVWRATTLEQCLRLQRYETSAYEPTECQVHVGESDSEFVQGLVFTWARSPSSDLVDGISDLEYWQKTHKQPMF
ncbi:hypothetical protein N658DRAFT_555033 [Parathielavia hyrcaniae]|uniref:Putative gamma-glutamylcyclotransferase n=1 Tax=Parathielavia hyrcaniae TaxID=113614 RepID=A0AAN6Q9G8_9PEZI|nr:hypothetical protein N658DRAFT_555033 [Parathielavia hyrcaniae]